jgi:hypothetical protein
MIENHEDKNMNIEHLGELTRDPDIEEWMRSSEIAAGYFDGMKLRFILMDIEDDPNPEDFIAAVGNFLSITPELRLQASKYVYKNYSDFLDAVGEDEMDVLIATPEEVWDHVNPTEIFVSRRSNGDEKIYVQITAECGWEIEHGLQIVYREGKHLNRVSGQDGHLTHCDAYNLPESEDRIC